MYTEAPICTRCCFCLPLRYGLIVWGYLKLFVSCLVLLSLCWTIENLVKYSKSDKSTFGPETIDLIVLSIFAFIAFIDIILTITYIVGCHQKNVNLLRIYNFYSKILVTLMSILSIYALGTSVYFIYIYAAEIMLRLLMYKMMDAMILLANVALQIYIILLIRSEIIKLDNRSQCRFVNNITEAECTVDINNTIEQLEREIENKNMGEDSDNDMRIYA